MKKPRESTFGWWGTALVGAVTFLVWAGTAVIWERWPDVDDAPIWAFLLGVLGTVAGLGGLCVTVSCAAEWRRDRRHERLHREAEVG